MATDNVTRRDPAVVLERQRRLVATIRKWMAEDDGYNERVWAILDAELKKDRFRLRDDDQSGA